jgi:hypothetical protein
LAAKSQVAADIFKSIREQPPGLLRLLVPVTYSAGRHL